MGSTSNMSAGGGAGIVVAYAAEGGSVSSAAVRGQDCMASRERAGGYRVRVPAIRRSRQ